MTPHRWLMARAYGNDALTNRILGLRNLSAGWCYGEGKAIDAHSIRSALKLAPLLRSAGALTIEAFPEQDGGVMISAYRGQWQIDIIILANGGFEFITINNGSETSNSYNELPLVERHIRGLNWRTKKSFAYFTHNTSAGQKGAILDWPSETVVVAGYRLSTTNAPQVKALQYATTLRNTMGQELQETQLSFGASPRTHFLTPRH